MMSLKLVKYLTIIKGVACLYRIVKFYRRGIG